MQGPLPPGAPRDCDGGQQGTIDVHAHRHASIEATAPGSAIRVLGCVGIGTAKPAHLLTGSVTARGVVNMTAVAVVEAQESAAAAAG